MLLLLSLKKGDGLVYADIALIRNDKDTDRLFTYAVPDDLRELVETGSKVSVPFGAGGKSLMGFVFRLHKDRPAFKVKPITCLFASLYRLSPLQLDLCHWMKEQYVCTYAQAIKCILPAERIIGQLPGLVQTCHLSSGIRDKETADALVGRNARKQRNVLMTLLEKGPLERHILKKETGISSRSLKSLEERGCIEIRHAGAFQKRSACLPNDSVPRGEPPVLQVCLLQGPEREAFYESVACKSFRSGKQVLLIAPDVLEAKRLYRVLGKALGTKKVYLQYGRLSHSRLEPFEEAASSASPFLLVGTRNTLFCDLGSVGAVIVHNENDYGHKSDAMPKFHSREVARYICTRHEAQLIYSSLSPSLSAYTESSVQGHEPAFSISGKRSGLPFECIDMRMELKSGNKGMISRRMLTGLKKRLSLKEPVLVLLNRKGHASHVSCRSCGYVRTCPECGMPLTFYGQKNRLECPHCSYSEPSSPACPECGSRFYRYTGLGPEKAREELSRLLPSARIACVDSGHMDTEAKRRRLWEKVNKGALDILIATEAVLRQASIERPALFVVLNADMFLNRQSFSANEAFFLLSRKIRAALPSGGSRLMVQTYAPEHPVLNCIAEDDYESFVRLELQNRRILNLPPFCNLALFHFFGDDKENVAEAAGHYARLLKNASKDSRFTILGPGERGDLRYKARYKLQMAVRYDPVEIQEFKGIIKYVNEKSRGKLRENSVRLSYDINIENFQTGGMANGH